MGGFYYSVASLCGQFMGGGGRSLIEAKNLQESMSVLMLSVSAVRPKMSIPLTLE